MKENELLTKRDRQLQLTGVKTQFKIIVFVVIVENKKCHYRPTKLCETNIHVSAATGPEAVYQ